MTVLEESEKAAWPDSAGELPFALQRYRRPNAAVTEDDVLAPYLRSSAAEAADEAVRYVGSGVGVEPRPLYGEVLRRLRELGGPELRARATRRDRLLLADGVTFGGADDRPRRPFPIDLVPRLLPAVEWESLSRGLLQRTAALSAFLADVYGEQRIIRAGVVPEVVLAQSPGWRDAGRVGGGATPPAPIMAMDLLRDRDGGWVVLEDNLRIPSGLGYAMQARRIMATVLPELTLGSARRAVSGAPAQLRRALEASAPHKAGAEPAVAVLSPGPGDSAWFEHRMLAAAMKAPLVLPRDLISVGDRIAILRPDGPRRLDVLYRRHGEDQLANSRSASGEQLLPQLLEAVGRGRLAIVNAVGNGVADDKAVYAYVPAMIRYYLGEEPLLPNVETRVLAERDAAREVLDHLEDFVVKPVNVLPGQGVVVGEYASADELDRLRAQILARPDGFVAQHLVDLSSHPTLVGSCLEPRRVDLRAFTVSVPEPAVLPTPLSRVALEKGSLIVNSAKGSGAKDTWIVD